MINRMDNICEAVIKGKWPSNRRQLFDFPGLLPGYGSVATDSPLQRRSLGDLSLGGQTSFNGSDELTMSPAVHKVNTDTSTVMASSQLFYLFCCSIGLHAPYIGLIMWFPP